MVVTAMLLGSCGNKKQAQPAEQTATETLSGLNPANFADTIDGKPTALYTLKNASGAEVCVTNLGGRIVSIWVPDRYGEFKDVVLGFDNVKAYANRDGKTPSDFGAAIGRYANRIGGGKFTLDGVEYVLPQNNYGHCLHGGPTGWQYQVYTATQTADNSVTMEIVSPDGDNNFPGEVKAKVTYTLTDQNALEIEYSATTDKPTVINMTNHSYFNLSGDPTQTILNDSLYLNSTSTTPIDETFMTTGEIADIIPGSAFDFTKFKTIGQDIEAEDQQVKYGLGFDHNWVLNTKGNIDVPAAVLFSPASGIKLSVFTTEPGVQVYAGNFLDGTAVGKKGIKYEKRTGICLETQKYPDTPNKEGKDGWPSCVLRPGETYNSRTIFQFGTL
jgi:aldose 1-epimerase